MSNKVMRNNPRQQSLLRAFSAQEFSMIHRSAHRLLVLLAFLPALAQAVGLNDTGIADCFDASAINATGVEAEAGSHPRQDCRYGRDAAATAGALTKTGAGAAGFDFTKIANDGSTLAAGTALGSGATDWACTLDNVTGLTWEVKVNDNTHLRHKDWTYSWYNSDASTNGGNAGTADGGNNCLTTTRCDTEKYVADINSAALCGYTDWRMPTIRELLSIAHQGTHSPSIDANYFPNTASASYWSSTPYVISSAFASYVNFVGGDIYATGKSVSNSVRLVRGTQF